MIRYRLGKFYYAERGQSEKYFLLCPHSTIRYTFVPKKLRYLAV